MTADTDRLLNLIWMSFSAPERAANDLFARRFDRGTLWSALALVTVLSVIAIALGNVIMGIPEELQGVAPAITPFAFTLILGASLVILVFALYFVGRMLGGSGTFPQSLLCVVWLQVLSLALQIPQLLVMILLPALGGLVSLVGLGLVLYALMYFINVLHGFDSVLKAIGTFILSLVGIAFGLSIILALIGATVQGMV